MCKRCVSKIVECLHKTGDELANFGSGTAEMKVGIKSANTFGRNSVVF